MEQKILKTVNFADTSELYSAIGELSCFSILVEQADERQVRAFQLVERTLPDGSQQKAIRFVPWVEPPPSEPPAVSRKMGKGEHGIMSQIHDYPSAFPFLTLTHMHNTSCVGLDDFGKPSFMCNYEFNACTTCQATGASAADMAKCVQVRRDKARRSGHDERKHNTKGCF